MGTSKHLVPRGTLLGSGDGHAPGQFEEVRSPGKNGTLAFDTKDKGVPVVKAKRVSHRFWDRDLALAAHAGGRFHWASLLLPLGKDTLLAVTGSPYPEHPHKTTRE